jgi:outer membrane protein
VKMRYFSTASIAMLFWSTVPAFAENAAPAEASEAAETFTAVSTKSAAPTPACENGNCRYRLTAAQLLQTAEEMVAKQEFTKAIPLVHALGQAPGYELQHKFLSGVIAMGTGDLKTAENAFRSILRDNPGQTRVRLELARVMMASGKEASADYHFRLALNDKDVPDDVAQTIRGMRGILRSKRNWHFNFDLGIAPDTNINSATSAETVNINFGPFELPLTLDADARRTSGIGQTGGFSTGLRLKASDKLAILIDGDGRFVNYQDKIADDFQLQLALGPELRLGSATSASVQFLAEERYYGGRHLNRDFGAKFGLQKVLNASQRIGIAIDGRKTTSFISNDYSGYQVGSNATFEKVVGKSFIASASVFGRMDMLNVKAYSSKSYGANIGIGGELPLGLNAGVSASISRAKYDAPQFAYSSDPRSDWRFFTRAFVGMRSVSFMGFSPSLEYVFSQNKSNYTLYTSTRHRANFKLSRFF